MPVPLAGHFHGGVEESVSSDPKLALSTWESDTSGGKIAALRYNLVRYLFDFKMFYIQQVLVVYFLQRLCLLMLTLFFPLCQQGLQFEVERLGGAVGVCFRDLLCSSIVSVIKHNFNMGSSQFLKRSPLSSLTSQRCMCYSFLCGWIWFCCLCVLFSLLPPPDWVKLEAL